MNKEDAKVIRDNYEKLVKNMEAHIVLGYLFQEGVLSDHNCEAIRALSTSRRQNEELLSTLTRRKNGLKMLIKALLVTEVQSYLGIELLEEVMWSEEDLQTFKLELEGKINQQQMLEADVASLKGQNSQLKSKTDKKIQDLTDKNERLEVEVCQLKATVEAFKAEKESLKGAIQRLETKNQSLLAKTSPREDETSETPEKNHYQLRARRYAISYTGGRAAYLADLKDPHKKPRSVRQN